MTQEILQYKGYYGSVNFSAEDKYFWGKIIFQEPIGINDVVSFEGLTLVHLKSAFEKAVDSYLQACLELKKEPQNVLQYNKMCAKFLGAIYSEYAEAWGFGNAKNIGSKMFHGVMYHNVIEAQRFEKELKFHSDWNWIIEVVEAIEKLNFTVEMYLNTCLIVSNDELLLCSTEKTKKEAVVQAINKFLIYKNKFDE